MYDGRTTLGSQVRGNDLGAKFGCIAPLASLQLPNLDVPERDLAIVILQGDIALGKGAELVEVLEFAGSN